jgi:hypothetical protein
LNDDLGRIDHHLGVAAEVRLRPQVDVVELLRLDLDQASQPLSADRSCAASGVRRSASETALRAGQQRAKHCRLLSSIEPARVSSRRRLASAIFATASSIVKLPGRWIGGSP